MVRIRLSRIGRKDVPAYRIVVLPKRAKRDTKFIEDLGFYQPITKDVKINKERAEYWLSVGAQPSDTVKRLFAKEEIIKVGKDEIRKFDKPKGKKASERAEAAAAEAEAKKAAAKEEKTEEKSEESEK